MMKAFINHYKKSFHILKEMKRSILVISIIFIFLLICGWLYTSMTYKGFGSEDVEKSYYEAINKINFSPNFFTNFENIFLHNLEASLFIIYFGTFLFIVPTINIFSNSYSLGYGIAASAIDNGWMITLLLSLPHNLFELPALLISFAIGWRNFSVILKKENRIKRLIISFKESMLVLVCIITPLLLIAAAIESAIIVWCWF